MTPQTPSENLYNKIKVLVDAVQDLQSGLKNIQTLTISGDKHLNGTKI